jgi:polysaccharide biosynthesis transport protein
MTASDVYRALWRRWFLIVVLTALVVGTTWYATSRQTRTYEASTLVRLQQRSGNAGDAFNEIQAAALLAQSYGQIIDSGVLDGPVSSLAATQLPPEQLANLTISASPVASLDLLSISASGPNAVATTVAANAAPQALRNFISQSGLLHEEIITVKKATIPNSPTAPRMGLNLAIALVLGLIFSSGLVLLLEALRDRLPETDELETAFGYPVLATIPTLRLTRMTAVEPEPERDRSGAERPTEAALVPGSDREQAGD